MHSFYKYMTSVWHYASFLSLLSLAVVILLSSSLFTSFDVYEHYQLVRRDEHSLVSRHKVPLLVRSSTGNGQLQAVMTEGNVEKVEKQAVLQENHNYSQILSSKANQSQTEEKVDSCDGRRIYMYSLPAQFNSLILQQCNKKIAPWLNFCPHFVNYGFGKAVNDSVNWPDWYETDVYMLEVMFHSRMVVYPCLTPSPHKADAFFIPYYSGLDALHYLYGEKKRQRGEHGVKLVQWLMKKEGGKYWHRHGGHDHFLVMGRTAWDFTREPLINRRGKALQNTKGGARNLSMDAEEGRWGTSFARLPEMENVTALFIERRPWRWLEQAIPYPTGFHPASLQSLRAWQDKVLAAKRPFLLAFVGGPRPHESSSSELRRIRQVVIDQCTGNQTMCSLLDCSKMKCAHASVQIAEHLLGAHFCLQPQGDTPTRRSTFDGLLSGCIPVFFSNDSCYNQYTWHLPPDQLPPSSYSVSVPAAQLHSVLPLLSSFSAQRIARMRSLIVERIIPRLIYNSPHLAASHPYLHDGFQITLDGMLQRVAAKGWAQGR